MNALLTLWQQRWLSLTARERSAVALTAAGVLACAIWWGLVAPAVHTLRRAPLQAAQLETQLQSMRQMQAQALALQGHAALTRDDAVRALDSAVKQTLGSTVQLNLQGDQAHLTLRGASPQALADWLAQVRINARAVPVQAQLQRSATGANGGALSWNGSVVLALPPR